MNFSLVTIDTKYRNIFPVEFESKQTPVFEYILMNPLRLTATCFLKLLHKILQHNFFNTA